MIGLSLGRATGGVAPALSLPDTRLFDGLYQNTALPFSATMPLVELTDGAGA